MIDRKRQQVSEGIGVDVARRVEEVPDVAPPHLVLVGKGEGVAEHRLELVLEDVSQLLDRQLPLRPASSVARVLVAVEGHLAEDGREGVLDLAAKERQPDLGVLLLRHDPVEGQCLAEHRCRLSQRQRRVIVEHVLPGRQPVMKPMPQLVRHDQRVAQLAGEVQQHVRVVIGRHAHAVGATVLARHDGGVDPAVLEEILDQRPGLLRESVVGAEHKLLRILPGEVARRVADRRVAIPFMELADVEELPLDAVVADADVVSVRDRVDQRLHGLVRCLVGQVA